MKHLLTLFITLNLACTMTLNAQSFDRALLDNYFDSLAHHDQAMGSLSIFQDGKEVYARAIGYVDSARQVLASPTNAYRVGSITKTFTAVIIHKLAAEGSLALDQKLADYYPNIPNADRITLDHLLRHQSGIANYTAAADVESWIGEHHEPEFFLELMRKGQPDFEPGAAVAYSNSNYLLLGYIAEWVGEMSYPELLAHYVTLPLGLEHTYYGGAIDSNKGEVHSFYSTGDGWEVAEPWAMSSAGAAGAITSTAAELNTFYGTLLRGELLPAATVEEMKLLRDNLGQGLFTFPFGKRVAYGHNGGIEGFETLSAHFPEENVTITYLSNGVRLPSNDVMLAALTVYFGQPFTIPNLEPVADLPEDAVSDLLGTYASDGFPLKITISLEGGKLHGRATGQGAFPLTPDAPNEFVYPAAGIRLKFDPKNAAMTLMQAGMVVEMERE
ncbi:serine hydrolase [Lewinella sp. 4G2]|uniref:serine hydrolase domain-containing protein n=1 Tax=Lewinella sp. 4G2 TaxID=1803372 RepID=UPI0007B46353|nr:serine hydrolase domain-containing protein [Lewinella sp. 4G2]OAV44229.1 hypothetical protein A3850_006850 [Lewinella sp. 4G2]